MDQISLDLQGADSAHYEAISRLESRLIDYPDGVRRLITLKSWYWQTLDQMEAEYGISGAVIASLTYDVALRWSERDGTSLEDELRRSFEISIRQCIYGHNEEKADVANENPVTNR